MVDVGTWYVVDMAKWDDGAFVGVMQGVKYLRTWSVLCSSKLALLWRVE